MLNRRSERKTSHTQFTFSSVLAVIGRPDRGSSAISFRPSLNALCHLPDCDLEMQSSLNASWRIWNVSVAFFPSRTQNLMAYRCSSELCIAPCYKDEKHTSRGGTSFHSDCSEQTDHRLPWKGTPHTTFPYCDGYSRHNKIMRITFIMDPVESCLK